MSVDAKVIEFPPRSAGQWRALDCANRRLWLNRSHAYFFDETNSFAPSLVQGRSVILDGAMIDNRLGFYCAVGEAVNGPGGYFGRTMDAFDDCLFAGFGLEFPYTIVWKHSQRSRQILGSHALLEYIARECSRSQRWSEEGAVWVRETTKAAQAGTRTLFDEIAELITTVASRGGGEANLVLR